MDRAYHSGGERRTSRMTAEFPMTSQARRDGKSKGIIISQSPDTSRKNTTLNLSSQRMPDFG